MSLRCKALTSCSLGINFPYCVRVFHLLQLYVLVSHHTDTPLYICNTHQEEQRPTITDGTDRLQLSIDTRQTLGKRPTYEDRNQAGTHPSTSPSKKNRSPQPLGSEYTSFIPQVNFTEGPSITKPVRPPRTLLAIPTQRNLPPPPPTHPTKRPAPKQTEHPPHRTTRSACSPK